TQRDIQGGEAGRKREFFGSERNKNPSLFLPASPPPCFFSSSGQQIDAGRRAEDASDALALEIGEEGEQGRLGPGIAHELQADRQPRTIDADRRGRRRQTREVREEGEAAEHVQRVRIAERASR